MADIIWSDVEAVAPELSTVDSNAQSMILAYVNDALSVSAFGGETSPKLRLARIYLAAHVGTLSSHGGNPTAGPVTAESADNISRSYATRAIANPSDWDATSYGQLYMALARTSGARLYSPRICR